LLLMQLLENDSERRALGQRAQEAVRSQAGATARTLEELNALLNQGPHPQPVPAPAAHTD
jgi:hypothetical protein